MSSYLNIPFLAMVSLFIYRAPAATGSGIIDPDYYWHLSYGDWILNNGRLPTADFWSWTMKGTTYRLTQWMGEVVMALANRAGGEVGTSVLAALLVCLTLTCSYRAARCYLDNRLAALAVAVGCNAILVSLSCRPHQFTHLGLACLTWIIAAYMTTGRRKPLYWIAPLFALWVNLHGGYAVGLAYLWMLVGAIAADKFVRNEWAGILSSCAPLGWAALAGSLATLMNPYGWGAWQYAVDIASLKSSSAGIVDEWAATSIKGDVGLNFFMVTTTLFACMIASVKRPSLGSMLCAFALTAAGWSAIRVSLMMTILMVPIISAWLIHTPFYGVVFDGNARRYDRTVNPVITSLILITVLTISLTASPADHAARKYVNQNFPQQEAQFMTENALEGRLLNPPEAGGFLLRQTGREVALDTRLDLYGDKALFEYLLASKGATNWKPYLERLDPEIILANNHSALRQLATESALYRLVYIGPRYSVMVKEGLRPDLETVVATNNEDLLEQLKK